MASAEHEPVTRVRGRAPGQGGLCPPEAESILVKFDSTAKVAGSCAVARLVGKVTVGRPAMLV